MRIRLLIVMLLTSGLAPAQDGGAQYFMGYADEISGKRFTYHSPFPDVSAALIMRGRADFEPIRWLTEVVPASYQEDFVSFIWVYSMDTDPEPVPFILSVDGTEWFRFSNPLTSQIGTWSIKGKEGAELKFNVTMLDKFGDEMGFAILKLPTSAIMPGRAATLEIDADPVKEWEIFLVQHTHSDIGYTRPQTEILAEHLCYIDHALDFCDLTDDYPEAAQFRWTCETSWSVREYLASRPEEQVNRLLKRISEGRIEATGMFLNFSEIIDEPALVAQTKTLKMLKESGIDVTTAMQNDVNGIAWCLVDYFHHTDVRYLTMGLHGHRARLPFDKPTVFWWQSPAGNRLLAYRSEHYMHGNTLSLLGDQREVFRANLSRYLAGLEEKLLVLTTPLLINHFETRSIKLTFEQVY